MVKQLKNTTEINEPKKKSKTSAGKKFEKDFSDSFTDNKIILLRLRDVGYSERPLEKNSKAHKIAINLKTGVKTELVRLADVVNPADFFAFKTPNLYFFELKSTQNMTSLPFSMLKKFQVDKLNEYARVPGTKAGFVFNFRELNETYFIEAEAIYDFYYNADRKSFPIQWVRENGISLPAKKKRTRYTFDLSGIFEIPLLQ